ncbi:MAG: hypothetical protein ACE37F_01850 [Nannocystaceae bacterium]|nr:hypothetical protein [bacterium]
MPRESASAERGCPKIKAAQLQANLQSLELLDEAEERRVRERLGPELIAEIREAGSAQWFPLEYDVRISLCVVEVCGFERSKRWTHDSTVQALGGALLRNLVRPALRLFGAKPQTVLRFTPKVLDQLLANCGQFSLEFPGEDTTVIVGLGLPDPFSAPTPYSEGYGEVFAAVCSIVGVTPSVQTVRVAQGHVEWRLSTSEAA